MRGGGIQLVVVNGGGSPWWLFEKEVETLRGRFLVGLYIRAINLAVGFDMILSTKRLLGDLSKVHMN